MPLVLISPFSGLLLVYGADTWLPNIMRHAAYSLGSSLGLLLVLNVGAVAGALIASRIADRFGSKPVTVTSFLLAVLAILTLGFGLPLYGAMTVVVMAGLGRVGRSSDPSWTAGSHPRHSMSNGTFTRLQPSPESVALQ
ncbi:hypothetical protein [Rhodococcus sp. NPDC055024]